MRSFANASAVNQGHCHPDIREFLKHDDVTQLIPQ